jgi:hypothetical protein
MRHPAGYLPEILDAYSRDGLYFAAIRLARAGADRVFELGITASAYAALRRMFQTRPFDQMPGLPQRYFFVGTGRKPDDLERFIGFVRIEQGRNGRNFTFEMPKVLLANLLWFYEMKTLEPAAHLHSEPPDSARPGNSISSR